VLCPVGGVVGQAPPGGASADKGSTVAVRISAGPTQVAVPRVAGQPRAQAVHTITALGLRAAVQTAASSNVPPGRVISTNPRAGTLLPTGGTVGVLVSNGPETVPVPDVTGELENTAAVNLTDAGLKAGTVTEVDSNEPPGTVISQNPAGGSLIPMGSTVDLNVARPAVQLKVPNVVGDGSAEAGAALGAAGFNVTIINQTVTNPAQVDHVIAQNPKPGKKVKRGTTVTLTIGSPATTTSTSATGATGATGPATTTTSTPGQGAAVNNPSPPAAAVAP
jgi:serine/threonine-protein kinase